MRLQRRDLRLQSFMNPERELRDRELLERIRSHVNSNPAVRTTALSVRWDRKVRRNQVGSDVWGAGGPRRSTSSKATTLTTVQEDSSE